MPGSEAARAAVAGMKRRWSSASMAILPLMPSRRVFLAALAACWCRVQPAAAEGRKEASPTIAKPVKWVAFYGVAADEDILANYDIVVLDPGFKGSIDRVASKGARVCGYLSLGEIRTSDPLAASLDVSANLPENPDWPGTRRVDIRHPSWQSLVLERRIPSLIAQGFGGLMFDTLDTPPYLELVQPERYRGMKQAAVDLVHKIRARWPELLIVMNRGYALLPDVVDQVDAVIAESLLTSPGAAANQFVRVTHDQVKLQLDLLTPAARRLRPMPILSLDYWDPDDAGGQAEIYRRERALGHHPYVATRNLDRIVPERT